VALYRKHFEPSLVLDKPRVMIAVFAIVAETAEKAEELAKAFDLWLLFVESDNPPPYYPSVQTAIKRGFSSVEKETVIKNRKRMIIGDAEQVGEEIKRVAELYEADEVTIIPNFFGADNRIEGIELLAQAFGMH
ncbi:LLM class flavin-dependent oxidoreductase, partial [Microvirga sp. 3-52]|nr:LLM class flavin-dependent oxidoreductase [Microvirga sp. 3-52]